jgi:selenide,water dikinase
MGGHSVEDPEPKFGMAVTGLLDPNRMFVNTAAKEGDRVWLSKPLGTGIVTTAAKNDRIDDQTLNQAIQSMSQLNREAAEVGLAAGVHCATDITGFGLAGHLFNVARASRVTIEIDSQSLPIFDGVEQLIELGHTTGGADKNRSFLGENFVVESRVEDWLASVVLDPQTSGGLALFSTEALPGMNCIGKVISGPPQIKLA